MATRTVEEKRQRIKELNDQYFKKVELLRADYRARIRQIMQGIEQRKIESIRLKLKQ